MNKPTHPFLMDPNPSEIVLVNPGEYDPGPLAVDSEVNSTAGGVGSGTPSRRDCDIVVRATVTRGYTEGKPYIRAQGLELIDEFPDRAILRATTEANELIEFEISPHDFICFLNFREVKEKGPGG